MGCGWEERGPGPEQGLGEDSRNLKEKYPDRSALLAAGNGGSHDHQGAAKATGLNLSASFPRVGRFTPCFGGGGWGGVGDNSVPTPLPESPSALLPPAWPLGPLEPPPASRRLCQHSPAASSQDNICPQDPGDRYGNKRQGVGGASPLGRGLGVLGISASSLCLWESLPPSQSVCFPNLCLDNLFIPGSVSFWKPVSGSLSFWGAVSVGLCLCSFLSPSSRLPHVSVSL